jgi:outer membrane receptor protein involved in Fe transport
MKTQAGLWIVGVASLSAQLALAAAEPGAGAEELDEVMVTASRIEGLSGFNSPTPTTIVTSEEFVQRAAVSVADVLNELPQIRPAGQSIGLSGAGVQTLNLRNLNTGPSGTRSLFLIDGRRVVGTNRGGQVDTNLVPSTLVERLEIVTGGASAAWGSDAVAGVVNVIFKKKLTGFSGNVQYGQSRYTDTKTTSLAGSWGSGFADDRGQFMVAAEYSNLTDPARAGDRTWGRLQRGFVTRKIDGLIYQNVAASGLTLFNFNAGGVITGANTALSAGGAVPAALGNATTNTATVFGPGGVPQLLVRSLDPAVSVAGVLQSGSSSGNNAVGGYGAWIADKTFLAATNKRSNIFLRGTYEFSPTLEGFVEANFNKTENTSDLGETLLPGGSSNLAAVTVTRNNPYLIATGLVLPGPATGAGSIQTITVSRYSNDLGVAMAVNRSQVKHVALGVNGSLGESWKWKSYLTVGDSVNHVQLVNNVIQTRFHAATNVILVGGTPACNTALTTATGTPSAYALLSAAERAACVPANPFGPNSFTAAVKDYVSGTLDELITNKQTTAGVSIQGEPFNGWAGPIAVIAGAEYRKESITDVTDPTSNILPRVTDFGINEAGGYQYANPKSYRGSYNVKEYFAETVVPLVRDLGFFKAADLNAAARRTDYSTSGQVTSWKLGLTIEPVAGLLLRGTRSRDIRAANLSELYSGANVAAGNASSASASTQDPLLPAANYNYTVIVAGNPTLTPELATTNVLGITWSPTFVAGLSASLDYFEIAVKNSIGAFGQQNIINSCGNGTITTGDGSIVKTGQPSNPYFCSRIVRTGGPNTATQILTVDNSNVNIGLRDLRGIDAELSYRFALGKLWRVLPGNLTLRALGTRINYDSTTNIAGGPIGPDVTGLFGNPHWKWTVGATYNNGPLTFNLQGLYNSATVRTLTPGVPSATTTVNNTYYGDLNNISSSWYINAAAQYVIQKYEGGAKLQLYGNINNVTDKGPQTFLGAIGFPLSATNPSQGIGGDLIGRTFVLGLRYSH